VLEQFEAIKARYREQGVTEECTMWVDFFKLRANKCTTTQVFIDKYSSGLAQLRNIPNVGLTDKQAVYQFIGAIEVAYPEYAQQRRADLRAGTMPVLQSMCNKLADEARRSDPVKAAYVTMTRQKSGGGGNQNNGNPTLASRTTINNAAAVEPAVAAIVEAACTAPHLVEVALADQAVAEAATVPRTLQPQPLGAITASALMWEVQSTAGTPFLSTHRMAGALKTPPRSTLPTDTRRLTLQRSNDLSNNNSSKAAITAATTTVSTSPHAPLLPLDWSISLLKSAALLARTSSVHA
jgi:hypothetical protein